MGFVQSISLNNKRNDISVTYQLRYTTQHMKGYVMHTKGFFIQHNSLQLTLDSGREYKTTLYVILCKLLTRKCLRTWKIRNLETITCMLGSSICDHFFSCEMLDISKLHFLTYFKIKTFDKCLYSIANKGISYDIHQ